MKTIKLFNQATPVPFVVLAVIEFLLLVAAVYLATWLRFSHLLAGEVFSDAAIEEIVGPILPKALLFASVLFISMMAMGLYSARTLLLGVVGVHLRLIVSHLVGFVAFVFIAYLLPTLFLGRGLMIASVALSLFFVVLSRHVFASLSRTNQLQRRILVYGAGENALSIENAAAQLEKMGVSIDGYVAVDDALPRTGGKTLLNLPRPLVDYVRQQQISQIVVALDDRRGSLPIDALIECKLAGVEIVDLPSFFEMTATKVRLDLIPPSWLIFAPGFKRGALSEAAKRAIDLLASFLLLTVSWPLMLLTAIAIKLEDGLSAPVIYKQTRIGKSGKPFDIYKFRSMSVDAEKGDKPQWASADDPRITRVGNIIRLLRLDELPQLLNVLKGDMSFVGPRPERPEFVDSLSQKIPYYNERHRVKPGVTGWAQLNYPYGASDRDSLEKLQYDLYYTKNHSLMLDLIILLQTVEIVLFGKGAR